MENLHEHCGVFGIYNEDNHDLAAICYLALFSMQHRGQDGAGIAVSDGKHVHYERGLGLVSEALDIHNLMKVRNQKVASGHVRYATSMDASDVLSLQPLIMYSQEGFMALSHNGHLVNRDALSISLRNKGVLLHSEVDSELMLHLLSRRMEYGIENAMKGMMHKVFGSYALVIMGPDRVVGVRDPWGIRPLCIGKLKNSYMLASESCAFDAVGGEFIRDVQPGEVVIIDENGLRSFIAMRESENICVFEYVYFARADSRMGGVSVYGARHRAGKILSTVQPVEADMVAGAPESSLPAALGYAAASGIPYGQALLKNPYVGRTFIQPSQVQRENSVRLKLTPLSETVKNKRIVLVDDSIVRGTSSIKIIDMLRQAGAKEVHLRISSPPVRFPCHFGINTPTVRQLIGSNQSVEDIRRQIGADTLAYLDLDMLTKSVAENGVCPGGFCKGCFDGKYPMNINKCKHLTGRKYT